MITFASNTIEGKSLIKIIKNKGPKTDPCGTPLIPGVV